jgi:tetratricopeptide (TPR) repeat protein
MRALIFSLFVGIVSPFAVAAAENYLGTEGVLHRIEEINARPGQAGPSTNEAAKLREDLKAFSASVKNMPPADAAKGWVALVDRAIKAHKNMQNFQSGQIPLQSTDLLGALPPPADWPALAEAVTNRPAVKGSGGVQEMGLRFLVFTLTGNMAAREAEITNFEANAKEAPAETKFMYQGLLQQLSQAIVSSSDNADAILQSLQQQLAQTQQGFQQPVNVPNLVAQVGPQKAEAFLRQALVQSSVSLMFERANETSRLAQKLALQLMDQMKSPQWGLINSIDSVDLYEAMDKHFAQVTNSAPSLPGLQGVNIVQDFSGDNTKAQAQAYYLLGLIARNRSTEAVALAKKLGGLNGGFDMSEALKAMERAGYTDALDNFLHELLSNDGSLSYWDEYVDVSAKAGTTDRMLALARTTANRQDLSDNKKAAIRSVLYKALLAADQDDEGVQEIRRLIAEKPAGTGMMSRVPDEGDLGMQLIQIGYLLQKPDWIKDGVGAVKHWIEKPADQNFGWSAGPVLNSLQATLFKLGSGPEAEAILTQAITKEQNAGKNQPQMAPMGANSARGSLSALATLYHRAGRYDDVLALLKESPDWGAADLSGLFDSEFMNDAQFSAVFLHTGSSALPVPYLAAKALIETGQKAPAEKIVNELLNRDPGLDRGYELLLALKGNDAIPKLDELFARDQFEERPLIWKAHLLRQQNQLADAEAIARKAISIDPSDGEEGPGDRMRAYAELADIREARGDKKEADFYREVVKSIRLSEHADEFYKAGLLKHAIPMYEEALNHFADAYCIQSRLAIQLAELGKTKEAEEHYRRAYELMPDSFGRVESHCFGCEKVFDGERAQGIAEKVFT